MSAGADAHEHFAETEVMSSDNAETVLYTALYYLRLRLGVHQSALISLIRLMPGVKYEM